MTQGSAPDAMEPTPSPGRGGADQRAAVVDPQRFTRQLRLCAISICIFALLATVGAVLAVSVFH